MIDWARENPGFTFIIVIAVILTIGEVLQAFAR